MAGSSVVTENLPILGRENSPIPGRPVDIRPPTVPAAEPPLWRRWELPTWGVVLAVYGGFLLLTWHFRHIPVWLGAPLGAVLLAWHGSLQHETIHGHPTRSRRLNAWLGAPPLALWMPYAIYRETHLQHHRQTGDGLTHPARDPESHYLLPGALAGMKRWRRAIARFNTTLAGRLTVGPGLAIAALWRRELRRFSTGDRRRRRLWLGHAAGAAAVILWVAGVCGVPLPVYLGLVVYPSLSLTLLRSFIEHRAASDPRQRTAVVEAHPAWALLFLNNNLHIAHHACPALPWYELPRVWRTLRPAAACRPGALFAGYGDILRQHLFRAVDGAEHPQAMLCDDCSGADQRAAHRCGTEDHPPAEPGLSFACACASASAGEHGLRPSIGL
jgi:fatty acid desaturase